MKKLIRMIHLDVAAVALKHQIRSRLRTLLGKDRRIMRDYFSANDCPKLQLACGSNHPEGWLNTDYYHPSDNVVCLDVTRRFPFPENTFTAILAEHVIEHFTFCDGKAMMFECFRTLKPGGVLRLSTPNIRFYTDLFEPENMEKFIDSYVIPHQKAWVPYAHESRATFVLNNLVRNWRHLFVYDFETVEALLKSVGFTDITLKKIGESDHPDLIGVDRLFRDAGDFECLSNMVLEAVKPVH